MYRLNEFPPATIFEVSGERQVKTENGETTLIEFATEVSSKRYEGKMFLPQRVSNEVVGQTPLIMVYHGIKKSKKNKDFHDLVFINIEKPETSKKEPKASTSANIPPPPPPPPTNNDEETIASFSDGEEDEVWIPPKCGETDECNEGINACFGYCLLCQNHMPYHGSQCRCVLKKQHLF